MNKTMAYENVSKIFDLVGASQYQILQNQYIQSLILLVILMAFAKLFVLVGIRYAKFLTRKTKTTIDDEIIEKTQKPFTWALYVYALRIALIPLLTFDLIYLILDTTIIFFVVVIVMRFVDIFLERWGKKLAAKTESRLDDEIMPIARKFAKIVIVLLGVMFILTHWNVNIAPLLASMGIAGVAVAFALQTTLGNILGGVSLVVDKTFKMGDYIALESGEMGTVHDVGLRSTKILNFDGELVTVPNGQLSNMKVTNWTEPHPPVRFSVPFGVVYGSDVEKVKKEALKAVKSVKKVTTDPEPHVYFDGMGDSSLNFVARCWVDTFVDRYFTKEEVTKKIYEDLKKKGIDFAFPTRTVYTFNKAVDEQK